MTFIKVKINLLNKKRKIPTSNMKLYLIKRVMQSIE